MAWISTTGWAVAACWWVFWLHVRPPCPPNFVRLIDFAEILPFFAGAGVMAGVLCVTLARRPGRHRVLAALMSLSTAVALVVALGAIRLILANRGAEFDANCWTF